MIKPNQKANKYVIILTLDGLENLAEYIAAEANHAENETQERKLDKLYDTVNEVLKKEEWNERLERLMKEIEDEISDK